MEAAGPAAQTVAARYRGVERSVIGVAAPTGRLHLSWERLAGQGQAASSSCRRRCERYEPMARSRNRRGRRSQNMDAVRCRRQARQSAADSRLRRAARLYGAAPAPHRMKILYLNPAGELGGAERSLLFLMASMRAAKPNWQIQLIAGSDGPLIQGAKEIGVDASAMEFPRALSRLGDAGAGGPAGRQVNRLRLVGGVGRAGVPSVAYLRRLRRAVARFAPDLIHSNGFKMHLLSAWACPARCPLIWHIRDYVSARPLMSRLIRANAHRCTAAVANSTSVAQDLRTVCGDKLRIHRVHNGVDLSKFSPQGNVANLDEICAMPEAAPNTIRVGMLVTMARG